VNIEIKDLVVQGVKWFAPEDEYFPEAFYRQTVVDTWEVRYTNTEHWGSIESDPVDLRQELISVYDYDGKVVTKTHLTPKGATHYSDGKGSLDKGWYYRTWGDTMWQYLWAPHRPYDALRVILTNEQEKELSSITLPSVSKKGLPPVGVPCEVLLPNGDIQGFRLLFKGIETFKAEVTNLDEGEKQNRVFLMPEVDSLEFYPAGQRETRYKYLSFVLAKVGHPLRKTLDFDTLAILYDKGLLLGQQQSV
jgi:hypothetical protein